MGTCVAQGLDVCTCDAIWCSCAKPGSCPRTVLDHLVPMVAASGQSAIEHSRDNAARRACGLPRNQVLLGIGSGSSGKDKRCTNFENLFMGLSLMGCFAEGLQQGNGPLRTSRKRRMKGENGRSRRRNSFKVNGLFWPAMVENGPSKEAD